MSHGKGVTLSSPSKINLFLEVLGKRADGFHELTTVMVRTDLCDVMHFCPRESGLHLRLAEPLADGQSADFPLDQSNLILRAAAALQEFAGVDRGAEIVVKKRIPSEAGLAGGSGNAATTLKALNQLWQLKLTTTQLHEIAASLGSDINFFVADCQAAVCTGRGEVVNPIPVCGSLHFVAVRPPAGNATPEVFGRLKMDDSIRTCDNVVESLRSGRADLLREHAFNRLTEAACELNPQMASLLDALSDQCGRRALMSGSGSTCFVFASNARESRRLKTRIAAAIPGVSFISELQSVSMAGFTSGSAF